MPTGLLIFKGNPKFLSEKALTHELGYRLQYGKRLSFDVATFYNSYDDLRSQEPTLPSVIPVILQNNLTAKRMEQN